MPVAANVNHTLFRVDPAVHGHLAAFNIEAWSFQAGIVRTTPVDDVYHTIFSVLPAVPSRCASLYVEPRNLRAGGMRTLIHVPTRLLGGNACGANKDRMQGTTNEAPAEVAHTCGSWLWYLTME